MLDTDKSRLIERDELEDALRSVNYHPSQPLLDHLMEVFDPEGSGGISLEQFCQMMRATGTTPCKSLDYDEFERRLLKRLREQDALGGAFEFLDKNASGIIEAEELMDGLQNLGYAPSKELIAEMMANFDINSSGGITEAGFLLMVRFAGSSADGTIHYPDIKTKLLLLVQELELIAQAFDFFDKDDSGLIEPWEIEECLTSLGFKPERDMVIVMVNDNDPDRLGGIDANRFMTLMSGSGKTSCGRLDYEELRQCMVGYIMDKKALVGAFGFFDKTNRGDIDRAEMIEGLKEVGLDPTEEFITEIMTTYGKNDNGDIAPLEFNELMHRRGMSACGNFDFMDIRMRILGHVREVQALGIAFEILDVDDSGVIDPAELSDALETFGFETNPMLLQEILNTFDPDGLVGGIDGSGFHHMMLHTGTSSDGTLDYEEFKRRLMAKAMEKRDEGRETRRPVSVGANR
eukprot:TRINITY_DN23993_c0_g1_i1.p1 TRINITY_DN23993_c0_g1~~TRINITY_DN23993_c0_g1_i1.p1  ORF type:complete len:540 (-),score=136.52 TRINITY_DN23993_c0_g1_i1:45-1427(-)